MARYMVQATWDDCPHLEDEEKEALFDALPPHQRDARSKGIPSLGSGAIFPVPESEIVVDPFELPEWYLYSAGMDVGWKHTAVVWFAKDPNTGTEYIYDSYKVGQKEPALHAQAVRARGEWIPVAIDPAARGRSQRDGEQLFQDYFDLGLDLVNADNSVESGIYQVWQALSTGKLKVFSSCRNWLGEYRIYRRDEKGHIVKSNDHLMDATRYGKVTGTKYAIQTPNEYDDGADDYQPTGGANEVTGY